MSRVIFFGLDNKAVGDFDAIVNRGYILYGNSSVSGEVTSEIVLPESVACKPWIQFGRLAMITHPYLEPWVGVLDPPWKAMLPVRATLYSAEYLLSLRSADVVQPLEGSAAAIISAMVRIANGQEELFVRMGDTTGSDSAVRQETITQKKIWEQMRSFCERTGTEMYLRPQRESDRLYLYVDLSNQFGVDTGYELYDGENANMLNVNAVVIGTLTNRMVGVSSQSTTQSRLTTDPLIVEEMIAQNRLRSEVVQFRDIVEDVTLKNNTQRALNYSAYPRLQITADLKLDDTTLARNLRRGNIFNVHVAKVFLPGGVQGWTGKARIVKYFYTETTNTASVTMEAFL